MENQNVRLAISFVVGVIVGVAGYWLIAGGSHRDAVDNAMMSSSDDMTASTTAMMNDGDKTFAVEAQDAGDKVIIKNVSVANPSWIAIHDSINGVPGRILGAQLIDANTHTATVMLLRKTLPGTSYIAMIHSDDGNYKNFNPKTDLSVKDGDGKEMMVTFSTK